ncbi:MAG: hypothetical protein GY701_35935, partial [Sulfitobacter sp.]|nr:hypothetical protein [Sulfitobacter sp.]
MQAGVMVDPVTYLLTALHLRYSPWEEESRITTMSEMLAFSRLPGEGINSLLARYETVRQRAAIEGQFVMSVEGCSLQILRACGIGPQHLPLLLQPFMGQLPRTDAQFQAMCTSLRRFGHITEGTPGNIAAGLQGFTRQARLGAYHGVEQQPTQDTFFGNSQTNQAPQDPYGETQPQALDAVSQDPFVLWGAAPQQGERQAPETWDNAGAFPVGEEPSGTDTDTSSDDGEEADDGGPDISRMSNVEAAEALFGHYRKGKRQWRRLTGKPVRKFRRFVKKSFFGKGKGKGKGKRRSFMYTADDVVYLLKGKGKGNHQHTSGKGFGRGKNPKDRSGNTLKCRICQSEDHFQAACPQRSGSQGIGGFSGLTLPEGSSSSGGRQASETGRGQIAPPWIDEDMIYDAPRDYYMMYDGQETDPWFAGQDPWRSERSHQPPQGTISPLPDDGAMRNLMPVDERQAPEVDNASGNWEEPGSSRVDADDELSDSQVETHPIRLQRSSYGSPESPAMAAARGRYDTTFWNSRDGHDQTGHTDGPRHTGYTTPIPPYPYEYAGTAEALPRHREGGPSPTERQLQNFLTGHNLRREHAASRRAHPEPEGSTRRLHLLRHNLPLSTATSRSAQHTASVTQPTPDDGGVTPGSLGRVLQSVNLMQDHRANRTQQFANMQSRAAGVAPLPFPPPRRPTTQTQSEVSASGTSSGTDPSMPVLVSPRMTPRRQQREEAPPPVFYDGAETMCTFCRHDFRHGERVCRMTCRHM